MKFQNIFIAVVLGGALIVAAFMLNAARPVEDTAGPTAQAIKATGKCAQCHRQETGAVVHQYEMSAHARNDVSCLDCHRAAEGQTSESHHGFDITTEMTAKNCKGCHATEYEQFARSRHAGPSWAAVHGKKHFSEAQFEEAMRHHPKAVDRKENGLAYLEGESAIVSGCESCHGVGKPNSDGSFGTCTHCHSRHNASVELARQPETCGQCHMGPDHSQLEIYSESKHGVLYNLQRARMNVAAKPKTLTTQDMPVPTCSTCHMSGLDGMAVTHDTTERLSWYLYAPVSAKRPGYQGGQNQMKALCTKCHAKGNIDAFYADAEKTVASTNAKVQEMQALMKGLRDDKLLTPQPFDEPIEFLEFDYWHYFGRTAKHGAFMGGADFVQWHGNYELLKVLKEMAEMAADLRARHGGAPDPAPEQ